jgi:hypothetical protein
MHEVQILVNGVGSLILVAYLRQLGLICLFALTDFFALFQFRFTDRW